MLSPFNALRSRKVGFLVVFLLNIIFFDVNIGLFKNEEIGGFGFVVEASESSSSHSMGKLDAERRKKHPDTGKLPRYPIPGMRYDELSGSDSSSNKVTHGKKKKKSTKSKKRAEERSKSNEGEKEKASKRKKNRSSSSSGSKSKKSSSDSTSSDSREEGSMSGGKSKKSTQRDQAFNIGNDSLNHKSTYTDERFTKREGRKVDKSKLSMSEYKSYLPGTDSIWQDPGDRKTYKHLNPQYGDYFPKIATKPYRKSNECSALFDSAKKAFENKEIKIHPADFVGLSLTLAVKLRDVLGHYVTIQETCLMLRMLLHLYSGMRTRVQFLNIIAAVLQNDILLGRISDDSGIVNEVMYILDFFLQLPKHRADNKSKQMSAIEISDYFHLEAFPKDNSYESRILPFYRRIAEKLMDEIEKRLGIVIARDEVMSMVYIILNFIEEERSQEQCTEVIAAVIGATYTHPLTVDQLTEIGNMARDILGCKASSGKTMGAAQIMDIFGPERTVIEMRQTALVGGPMSDTLRIWKEIGTLDYLGRVISVRFNDCNGIKAWEMNRICSMLEVMNKKLIKTGSSSDIITLEELCGAFKYKKRHPGTKWSLAINTTLQKRQNGLPVRIDKLFSHFLAHEKRKLASLEGSTKSKMEKFYMIPEFPKPSFLDSIIPSSPAQGIPPADHLKPDFFYAFNSMPGWIQNRFIFASAFMEEILVKYGNFVHISPVRLYNALGGRLDEDSDVSLVIQGLGLTQEQYKALPKAFCGFEKKLFNEHNLNFSPTSIDSYFEALYEYPLASYVEGRYLIEAAISVLDIMNQYLSAAKEGEVTEIFPQLVTQERLQRVYLFQGFINSRIKVYSDSNITFITTEEANRILQGCVDNNKVSYVNEMRINLNPEYFTDSLIEILAQEWSNYEGFILPQVLDLHSEQGTLSSIYSMEMTFAALTLDGWELLIDPTIYLRNLANRESLVLNYSANSVKGAAARENRSRLIYNWMQQYFIYKLRKIPKFNYEEVRTLAEVLPNEADLSEDRIKQIIKNNQSLNLSDALVEDLTFALKAYLLFEKYFLYTRNPDLEGGFATEIDLVNGKIYIPSCVWTFVKDRDDYSSSDIENQSVIYFADLTLAYLTRLFQTQPQNQEFFIKVLEWANKQNLNDDSIFFDYLLSIEDFKVYIQHNTRLSHNSHIFLVPWVDHLPTNYHFRRLRSLPSGTSPGLPSEGPGQDQDGDQAQSSRRAAQILSEIERLSLEHSALLDELNAQVSKEDTALLVVEKIRNDIHNLLMELGMLSSTLLSSAMMILSKRMIAPSISVSNTQNMSDLGVHIGENGEVTFDEELAERGLSGVFIPALVLGSINPETGILEPTPGSDPELSCSTQNINRMQAFRIWLSSVLPRMPFHCSDPLIARDLLSVRNLLPAFVTFGYSQDSNVLATSLVEFTSSHPFPMTLNSLNIIVKSFIEDESSVLLALDRPANNLEEAYKDLRMIEGFYKKKTTLPSLEIPTIFSFTPNLELLGSADSNDLGNYSQSNARVNFLDYLERITAEYFASSPRRMPTIAIPRLTNLAISFSNDFEKLVFLIASVFGPTSPYISAPSIGASASSLAEFYLMNLPFSDTMDSRYIENEFKTTHLEFGSPIHKILLAQTRSDDQLLDFKHTFLSAHFFSSDEAYFNSFLAMSDLINLALSYTASKTGISADLNSETFKRISFSFITGQNILEIARTSIDISSQNLGHLAENIFYSTFAKSWSFLISQFTPYIESSDNRIVAEEILQSAISDIYTTGFYPENVRYELVNRITLFVDFDSEKYQFMFSDLEESLNSSELNFPKKISSHPQKFNQRFLTQTSEVAFVSGQSHVARTPICNYALVFSFFITKVLEKPQNRDKIGGLDPFNYSDVSIWSGFCGLRNFEYLSYKSVLISIIKNLSMKLLGPLSADEINRLVVLIDFYDQNVRKIVLRYNPDLSQNCSNETLFSNLDACLEAMGRYMRENDIILDDLQLTNSSALQFSDELQSNHFSLLSSQEESMARVMFRSVLEDVFFSNSFSELQSVPGINKQISLDFFSDAPLKGELRPESIVIESFDDLYRKLPFNFKPLKLNSGSKSQSSIAISYLDVGEIQKGERYDLENSFLHDKKIIYVNRAVFFLHWWLIVWPKIPFYTNDFVLAELLSNIEILAQAFQTSSMMTSKEVIFSSISKQISGISGVSLKKKHIYLMIDSFLNFEYQAFKFSGAKDLESAYSNDTGMLNSIFSIDLKIPQIPIPRGNLVTSVRPENKNLSQYLFRIISEYFAASPRNYPTIIIPNTSFIAKHFDLNKNSLAYVLYIWSEFEDNNSIRVFFQAPTIGASYEDLADFIIENFELNFLNFSSSNSYLQFFTDPIFSTFFKFGSPLFRVKNIPLGFSCSRTENSCNPFIPKLGLSEVEELLEENIKLIVSKSFAVASQMTPLSPSSDIITSFFSLDVSEAIMLGINVLDAIRVHGFGSTKLNESLVIINKFSLLFSRIFSRFVSRLLESFHVPNFNKLALDLRFTQLKTLSARTYNVLSQFSSDIVSLTLFSNEDLSSLLKMISVDDLVPAEKYQAFYAVPTSDSSRGMMTVYTKGTGIPLHLQITRFNYVYCFIHYLLHILSRIGMNHFHISFKHHNLLSFENVVRATAISVHEGIPESVFTLISHKYKFSLGDFTIDDIRRIYIHFKTHTSNFFSGGSIQLAFASSETLTPFIQSLFAATKYDQNNDSVPLIFLNEFENKEFSSFSPKSQSLSSSITTEEILNSNYHLNNAFFSFKETSFVTGSFVKPWVPLVMGLSSEKFSSVYSEASNDHLVRFDPGHVQLRKKLKQVYNLNQNLDLGSNYNPLVDLGQATLESGVISLQDDQNSPDENQFGGSFNGLRLHVLNRAVLFREWLIRIWDISPAISRDPIFAEFLNDFESIIGIFDGAEIRQGTSLRIDIQTQFIHKTARFLPKLLSPIIAAYNEFEERIVRETGGSNISRILESGIAGLFLLSLPINDPFQRKRCQIKSKAWGEGSDSHRRSQIHDFVTQKLVEYLSAAPRSAFTIDIPDVSIILDNFSIELSHKTKCAIEFWARDRPDLISAPSLGLDPDSIFSFLSSFLTTRELDQDNLEISIDRYMLSYGLLNEYPIQDAFSYYGDLVFAFREHENLYQTLVASILGDPVTINAAVNLFKIIAANVLDTYDFNHFPSEDTEDDQGHENGDSYIDYSLGLDYKAFSIRVLLGVSESFSARKLFEPIQTLKSAKDLNKISSDFLRKVSVLKLCVYDNNHDFLFYEYYSAELALSLQRSGLRLTETDVFNLFLNHMLVNLAKDLTSKPELITDCLSNFKFKQRPSYFSTVPEFGHVSQNTGLITSSFKNLGFTGLQESFVPQVNLLVYYLKSLNWIVNHPGNKIILSIPASINFMSTGILLRASSCSQVTNQGFLCIAQVILNSLMETGSDVGNLTADALTEILGSLFDIVGDVSYSSYPKLDSQIGHIDPIKNRKFQKSIYSKYNQNLLSLMFGNIENLERVIRSKFERRFLDVRTISKSLEDSYNTDPLINAQLSVVQSSYYRKKDPYKLIAVLKIIPTFNVNSLKKSVPLTLNEFLAQMNLKDTLDFTVGVFPTILLISRLDGDMVVSKDGSFPDTSVKIANRAATFHSFIHITTYKHSDNGSSFAILPNSGGGDNKGGVSLEECINFFSGYSGMDILESTPKISKYFKKIEFHKAYLLLDSFYAIEKELFGFDAIKETAEDGYYNVARVIGIIDSFIPLKLNLEIPKFEGEEAKNLGRIILFLGLRFFKNEKVRAELTLEKCILIARSFWPSESDYNYTTSKHSNTGYFALLSILENLSSIRKFPTLAQEFLIMVNWYIYNAMGSDPVIRDFSNPLQIFRRRVEFLRKAFSKPFVCSEKDLPWVKPDLEYSGVSFQEFNFIMYIATAWRTYLELKVNNGPINIDSEEWSEILKDARPGLISMLDSLSYVGEKYPNIYEEDEMMRHIEVFLDSVQRFARIRHPGIINVSFLWPAVDCEPSTNSKSGSTAGSGKMVVPGLTFPLALNSIGSSDSLSGSRVSKPTTREILIDSFGEFFQEKEIPAGLEDYNTETGTAVSGTYSDTDIDSDNIDLYSGDSTDTDNRVQEEINRGFKLEDLADSTSN
ncbi:putative integral membrane protein [Cryptosporidium meleagridis]|uniref:Putative integral membrane protein n=1 Tax=Cryptosporidium meleagridis TaxID=93969 RepID=A0A2P4Z210_9CRYT|nr:putative integral membrane protein [Cryptosporidium meleagridis]